VLIYSRIIQRRYKQHIFTFEEAKMFRLRFLALVLVLVLSAPPSVEVVDQVVIDGTVTIGKATLAEPGFIVIHKSEGDSFGAVIGQRLLSPDDNFNVTVPIDVTEATPILYAMLHSDTGEAGVYEFGTVDGADLPVTDLSGRVVAPFFGVSVLGAQDQLLDSNTYTAASVTVSYPGWLVIHADNGGQPGPVLGQTLLETGTTADVAVELAEEGRTPVLWPMLHVDTGTEGEYEFGTVEGADGPIIVDGVVATAPVWTVPHLRVSDQILVDNTITVQSALLDVPGFVVIHQEQDGSFGPVAGVSEALPAGLSTNLSISLDPAQVTPRLWPMLHVDTGTEGEYEFGTVEGADGPVTVDGEVVTFGIDAAPSITYTGTMTNDQIVVSKAVIDAPGWLVIHSDNSGQPGPVVGQTALTPGVNTDVLVTFTDPSQVTAQVFPMLHYDTGEAGVYEFGTVEGADLPVSVDDNVVVGLFMGAAAVVPEVTPETTTDSGACTLSPASASGANLRAAPSVGAAVAGSLGSGATATGNGQAIGSDGFIWYQLTSGAWVRSDVVTESGACASLPTVAAPAVPEATVPEPAGTDEP
jgi:hypothetical protein